MSRIVGLFLYGFVALNGNMNPDTPVASDTKEGMSVYTRIPPAVNRDEEVRIQLDDQNGSRKGS